MRRISDVSSSNVSFHSQTFRWAEHWIQECNNLQHFILETIVCVCVYNENKLMMSECYFEYVIITK